MGGANHFPWGKYLPLPSKQCPHLGTEKGVQVCVLVMDINVNIYGHDALKFQHEVCS
jgi:hypothetical protein